jgi:hypothetical protein
MAQRIAGIAYLKVDGNQYPLRGNLTVSPSPFERAMIAGQDYVHGYSELPRVPYIEGDFSTLQGLSVESIANIVDSTVTAELANETTFVLRQACCRAALEVNAREGQFRARFEGVQCDEILP